jgi:dTDP-4-amino-4,6-dideoxygalactose transaminase
MRIPLTQMDHADPALLSELLKGVERVASTGAFTLGAEVEAFEREFAAYCEAEEAVGVASGTEALALGLRALGIGPGDEVIVPASSFIASAEAVTLVGATPRLVDVDPGTHLVTAEIVERNLRPGTRCVVPVHLYGRTVDMDPIVELARDAGIAVLEDACQAHGARYRGRRVGSIGDAGCFSFYPAKNLGAWGDAGALVTSDPELADRVRLLRSHGERPRYHHRVCGTTGRLDAIQAAVLRVKLRLLDTANDARRDVAAALTRALADADVHTPATCADGEDHVFHQYVVRTLHRDALREHLAEAGIASGVHYPVPIHLTGAYASLGLAPGSLPVAERLAHTVCSLPIFPAMTGAQVEAVARSVHGFGRVERAAA